MPEEFPAVVEDLFCPVALLPVALEVVESGTATSSVAAPVIVVDSVTAIIRDFFWVMREY